MTDRGSPDIPEHRDLRPEIAREIRQVAHFGSAGRVKELVAAAATSIDQELYEEALPGLLEAKTRAPRSVHVRELLGLVYYQLGKWREAAREFAAYRRLSDKHDRDPEFADCERALGRPEKAVEILRSLPRDEVTEDVLCEALVVHAGALNDLGRHDEAVAVLESGPTSPKEVEPHHLRLWYALADSLELADRRRDSRPWWDLIYAEDAEFFDVARRRLGVRPRT
jgi:tetratricopeptide (TPR) repeat protein